MKLSKSMIGGTIGGVPGAIIGSQLSQRNEVAPPPDLSSLEQQKNKEQERAKQFRANQAGMQEDADRSSRMQGRAELARQLGGIGKSFNQRGLLYSGARGAAEMGANANIASGLAGQSMESRNRLEGLGRDYENQALQTGVDLRNAQQQAEDLRFQNAVAQREARNSALAGIGGALGQLGGAALGRKSS